MLGRLRKGRRLGKPKISAHETAWQCVSWASMLTFAPFCGHWLSRTIGEIHDIKADESVLGEGGFPDIDKIRPFIFAPGEETYHSIGQFLGKAYSMGRDIGKS